jgi:hypothetical protein
VSEARQDRRRSERIRADWSGRFETPGVALDGRIVDLSLVSARMRPDGGRAPATIAAGVTGTLTLSFPAADGHVEVLRIQGTVVRAALDGVAFTFASLPESAARWLTNRLRTGEARRRAPRLRIALPVEIQQPREGPVAAETLDLSAYGARIRTSLALAAGDRLDLLLPLETGRSAIVVPSVVWETSGNEAVLMFVNLQPRDFNRIGDYVASRLPSGG